MGIKQKNLINSTAEYNRTYRDMRGVDFSSSAASTDCRYAYLENMYRDYDGDGGSVIESIPGFRRLFSTHKSINGLFLQNGSDGKMYVIMHTGSELYRFEAEDTSTRVKISGAVMNDAKSFSFVYGSALYICDGTSIFKINGDGSASEVSDTSELVYCPTVYLNGEEYEQRNLLTCRFFEKTDLSPVSKYARATPSLRYRVTDWDKLYCSVSGISDSTSEIFIPSVVKLGGKNYTVTGIDSSAFFYNTDITKVHLSDTVRSIGEAAFMGCSSLSEFIGGEELETVADLAFYDVPWLSKMYFSASLKSFGAKAFSNEDFTVEYELVASAFVNIPNAPTGATIHGGIKNCTVYVEIPVCSPTKSLRSVLIDGEAHPYSAKTDTKGYIKYVYFTFKDKNEFTGKTVEIYATSPGDESIPSKHGTDFTTRSSKKGLSFVLTLRSCSMAAVHDGRLFLSGNPSFPATVFYSNKIDGPDTPLYFGSLDFFEDGGEGVPISSMLPSADGLAVFKTSDSCEGSIFYHEGENTEVGLRSRIYPVSEIHRNDEAVGASAVFYDDAVFLSGRGLCALGKKSLNLSRSVEVRSSMVNPRLRNEDLSKASVAIWKGYLAVSVGGRMYLADSRATFSANSSYEYEWFYLNGIGTYSGDSRVYRYSDVVKEGYARSDTPDSIAEGTVYSENTGGGTVYYVIKDGAKTEVYPTEEFAGGVFSPAAILLACGELLFFATESGDLCVFNNDKRGVPPDELSLRDDFDAEEYARSMGNKIHPAFYDFASHAPRYALRTQYDDCGLPHLTKSTVRKSLAVKFKTFVGSSVRCEVGCDLDGFEPVGEFDGSVTDFDGMSFDSLSFGSCDYATVLINEKKRGWIEKSLSLYSDKFHSPIGIYSITYRYKIKGKIKYV